jgi:hypothetical protein
MGFQDEIHLSVISDALWEGIESGRAALLVGAGFSRNAEPTRINSEKFPLWGDVAQSIVEHLYSDTESMSLLPRTAGQNWMTCCFRRLEIPTFGRARYIID